MKVAQDSPLAAEFPHWKADVTTDQATIGDGASWADFSTFSGTPGATHNTDNQDSSNRFFVSCVHSFIQVSLIDYLVGPQSLYSCLFCARCRSSSHSSSASSLLNPNQNSDSEGEPFEFRCATTPDPPELGDNGTPMETGGTGLGPPSVPDAALSSDGAGDVVMADGSGKGSDSGSKPPAAQDDQPMNTG